MVSFIRSRGLNWTAECGQTILKYCALIVNSFYLFAETHLLREMDGVALWEYQMRHANVDQLLQWVRTYFHDAMADDSKFPYGHPITLEMVDLLPGSASVVIKDIVLDELARSVVPSYLITHAFGPSARFSISPFIICRFGMFCKAERENFSSMLARLCKFGGLRNIDGIFGNKMAAMSVGKFHESMVSHCLEEDLVNFLWTYMEHYR